MQQPNPYQPTTSEAEIASKQPVPRSKRWWALAGFVIGAIVPVVFGIYRIQQFQLYVATLPPGQAICGTPVFTAYVMIFVAGPICGTIGATAGFIMAAAENCWSTTGPSL